MVAFSEMDDARRFGGLQRLYGVQAASRLRQAHVVVVGLGGVGSWAAEALARSGVARLTLIDLDHVAESNINRQIHALDTTLGQAKVQAMQERIAHIHPACQVDAVEAFVDADNWPALLPALPDGVIDACDQVRAKQALAAWSRRSGVPLVCVGAAGGKRSVAAMEVADLSQVTHDPLLTQLRARLRKHEGAPREGRPMGIHCVFSREPVAPPDASCAIDGDGSLNCHGYGSVVGVTAGFGFCAATEMLNLLARPQGTAQMTL